jgi:hypothetical protein
MIIALRYIYRSIFSSRPRRAFLELFENNANLVRAIVLEEICPLPGIILTYFWQEYPDICRLQIRELNLKKKSQRTLAELNLPQGEITEVLRNIEEAGGVGLGNFAGMVKDGVFYNVLWGDPAHLFHLSIKNPQVGSERHQHFISMLKQRARENNAGES